MIQSEYTSNEVMNFMMAQSKPQIPHPHDVTHIKRDNLLNPIIAKDMRPLGLTENQYNIFDEIQTILISVNG